ncbi:PREDICTED: uncharacterized protein LOC104608000 isoform X2 [Nelumbo nucifera]|uniref:Uncharacterized protein LOC104608000 isoform X2 n=1 Tax=Nelumbo nucifera TaxID=4432 RepID=A0A1U8B7A7_NELNU|nr:PREDICTED: uncharacterized protein LOC104608000 isoform X2 [Nelumbo nucifera]
MAGADSQKHLLTFIRDFASEKSHGERRLDGLKRRIQDLQSELGAANVEHGDTKRSKETTEQELQGYEVELSLNEASIQALEARISAIQDEISKIGYDLEALKNDEEISRDKFITEMFEFNKKIRQFQETNAHASHKEKCLELSSDHGHMLEDRQAMLDTGVALKGLEDELAHIISQTHMEEQQYQEEQTLHEKQVVT